MTSVGEVAARLRAAVDRLPADALRDARKLLIEEIEPLLHRASQGDEDFVLLDALGLLAAAVDDLADVAAYFEHARALTDEYAAEHGGGGIVDPGGPAVGAGSADSRPLRTEASTGPDLRPPAATPAAPSVGEPVFPGDVRVAELNPTEKTLVAEALAQGIKISPDRVLRIGRAPGGRIVWLETGNANKGLRHMLERGRPAQFADQGVAAEHIPDVVLRCLLVGTPVGVTGRDRVVYETEHRGQLIWVGVTVADNGFIVSANPVSRGSRLKPLKVGD
ncbi:MULTISPECIES: hypothetical protein [Actinoalloteichus]|uniref:Uncharacterized protein n=1 Tax=Actinoalloteichus fjordicus TaxID=1612552 RepID=A0AAC9PUV6_9PSEU|nr:MULTISPECIES: hypothetical protein [Actinoalloteichus]APU17480.1 hypothetical protein UA74_27385 [Actinoalloteichus fjordicus]APU23557.1 hypothetical protein UA75_27930 [Actinoalloteichus sp. GBA129-24]